MITSVEVFPNPLVANRPYCIVGRWDDYRTYWLTPATQTRLERLLGDHNGWVFASWQGWSWLSREAV